MSATNTSPALLRCKAAALSALFGLLLCLPTLDWLCHLDSAAASNENRLLAAWPQAKAGGALKDYLAGFEAWFNDHFGFRRRLIATQNAWKHFLFGETPSARVLVGSHGWYFPTEYQSLDNYLGKADFSPARLAAWRHLLEKRRDWLARHGVQYLFVITPDKQSIYPEELPEWLSPIHHPSNADRFEAYMRTRSSVPVLNLRSNLWEAKQPGRPLYLKTDTHWNALGAFFGYQAVVRALGEHLTGLEPLPLTAFKVEAAEPDPGDLALMLGVETPETQRVRLLPEPPLRMSFTRMVSGQLCKTKTPETIVVASGMAEARFDKLILFRDSYARPWSMFLGYHFKKVLSVWQFDWDKAFLEREKPTVVIDECVERFFNTLDPAQLEAKDGL